jgi:hypothetical protein
MPISAITDYLSTLLFLLTSNPYTMVTYKFKLINSQVPVIKGKNIITDSNVGGIKNTYDIIRISGPFGILRNKLGTKTFLRPYQNKWPVKWQKLPPRYWGKGPFINMWLLLSNDYDNIKNIKALMPETDTMGISTKILGIEFKSQILTKNLKSNQSFTQSKFVIL